MEGIIYIAGALVFGFGYAFLKPIVEAPWLIAIAIAYFWLLRLAAQYAAKYAMRREVSRATNRKK
ncbi:MAG: hypothetical protein EOP62_23230 [Sphingomonadales bacterium]|nr:MAG: hypothetical protein EOP62_23230 [Sphingomonadales bacterium]